MRPSALAPALAIAAALITIAATGVAAEDGESWTLGGTIGERTFASYAESGALDAGDFSYGSATAIELRLDARDAVGAKASASAAVDAFVRAGAAAATYGELSARVRELVARLDLGYLSLEGGRRVVNYGRAPAWSPVDIYAAYDRSGPTAIRLGTDALRLRAPLGATGMADLVAAPATGGVSPLSDGRYSLRTSGLVLGADSGLIGAWDGLAEAWLAGADLSLDLGPILYGEGLCMIAAAGSTRFRAAAGFDWYVMLRDSEGASLGKLAARTEYCYDGAPYPSWEGAPDAHNIYAGLSWADDRAAASVVASLSLPGEIASATAIVSVDAAQNATLSLYARGSSLGGALAVEAGLSLEVAF